MLGGGLSRSRIRSRRRFRGRVRCENAGLSDKAEDGSQKQNMFYHRFLFNTLKNAKFRKKIPTLAKERACWSTTARTHLRQGERSVPRNERCRYLLNVLNECIELLSIQGGLAVC